MGGVAKTKIPQTLRFAPPQESFALSLHAKHAGTAKGTYCMCFVMQRKGLTQESRRCARRMLNAAHIPPRARLGRIMQGTPHGKTCGKNMKIDRRDPKMRLPAAQGSLQVPKCPPAAALSLPEGTWRRPSGPRRHPKRTPWSPKSGQGGPIKCQEAPRSASER